MRIAQIVPFIVMFIIISVGTVLGQFNYVVNKDNTITITEYTGPGGAVSIPPTINGLPVASIGLLAFSRWDLTTVTIPNSITNIEQLAFQGCSSLISVTIPDSVTIIGDWAFDGCTSLTNVTLGSGVNSIGIYPFSGCTSLTAIEVDIKNQTYSSLEGVLFNKLQSTLIQYPQGSKIGSYTIPEGVITIRAGAFARSYLLTSVTIPNSVTSTEPSAFTKCTSLKNLEIGGGLTNVGNWFAATCTNLTSITIPNSVTRIGVESFEGCIGLTNVSIGTGVKHLGNNAFARCSSLGNITIPGSVTEMFGGVFLGCTGLTNVTISVGVTMIGGEAFEDCTSLPTVTIPNSVTSIESYAFSGCTNLTSIAFEGNAPIVDANSVFYGSSIMEVYFLPGTTGWGLNFAGRPTSPWVLPNPRILTTSATFGLQTNSFAFRVSWATNASIVVEGSPCPANSTWLPVSTNTLVNGWSDFRDTKWTNYPARFYRIRSV